mmetsp:Transcript_21621/g.36816  ORF Transcript_21621/g.36816 Transcript_21621/m.36816 type:complete len:151 (-) Transcript_21621:1142-1594(-)
MCNVPMLIMTRYTFKIQIAKSKFYVFPFTISKHYLRGSLANRPTRDFRTVGQFYSHHHNRRRHQYPCSLTRMTSMLGHIYFHSQHQTNHSCFASSVPAAAAVVVAVGLVVVVLVALVHFFVDGIRDYVDGILVVDDDVLLVGRLVEHDDG